MKSHLARALSKTRGQLKEILCGVFQKEIFADEVYEALEEALLLSDMGIEQVEDILDSLKENVKEKKIKSPVVMMPCLREIMRNWIPPPPPPPRVSAQGGPLVHFFIGVNGSGKTTSIGKMSHRYAASGEKVLLIGADTFRAGAIEQLRQWAEKTGVEFISQKPGADGAAVVFDGIQAARHRGIRRVMVDTAGRLQTNDSLLEELKKMLRVAQKALGHDIQEVVLVVDGGTGQNGLSQVKIFSSEFPVHSLIMTKLDTGAKGGAVISASKSFQIPLRWIGVGEGFDDLIPFDRYAYLDTLLEGWEEWGEV